MFCPSLGQVVLSVGLCCRALVEFKDALVDVTAAAFILRSVCVATKGYLFFVFMWLESHSSGSALSTFILLRWPCLNAPGTIRGSSLILNAGVRSLWKLSSIWRAVGIIIVVVLWAREEKNVCENVDGDLKIANVEWVSVQNSIGSVNRPTKFAKSWWIILIEVQCGGRVFIIIEGLSVSHLAVREFHPHKTVNKRRECVW